jgi:hypothetical protein
MKSRTIKMLERRLEERTLQLQFATRPESSFWPRTTICDSRCIFPPNLLARADEVIE